MQVLCERLEVLVKEDPTFAVCVIVLANSPASDYGQKAPNRLDCGWLFAHYPVMNPVLYSDRLKLTPLDTSDVDLATEMFTDPDVLKFAGGAMSADEIREEMSNWIKRGGNGCIGVWCITDRGSGEKMGSVALLPMPVEEDDTDYSLLVPGQMPSGDIEVGYFLKRSAWGKGYATEACRRLIQVAFEELRLTEVVATFEVGNHASQNVLEKTGFVARGTMRCYGEEGPSYRITRDEWLELRRPT